MGDDDDKSVGWLSQDIYTFLKYNNSIAAASFVHQLSAFQERSAKKLFAFSNLIYLYGDGLHLLTT